VASQPGLVIIKEFDYRGTVEQWTNKYWFTGSPPSGEGAWRSLFDQITNAESNIYTNAVSIVGGIGYDDNTPNAPAAWGYDIRGQGDPVIAGKLPEGDSEASPGDTAVFCWWLTSRRSNPGGKPVYLRKYFHDARNQIGQPHDAVATAQHNVLLAFADGLGNGSFGYTVAAQGHPDESIITTGAGPWITTRTLKRRGKRKKVSPSTA